MLWRSSVAPFLPDRDYLPVALPTTDVAVLQALTRDGRVLRRYGRLDRILAVDPAEPRPTIHADQPVANASGAVGQTAKIGIGLNVVSSIIQALGGEAGLNITADNARQVKYTYSNVTSDRVDLATLDEWLAAADLRPNLPNVADLLATEGFYLVVGVLRAGGLEVEFLDENSAGVEVDVPALQAAVGGKIAVSGAGQRSSKLVFTGPQALTVAAKAAQLRFGPKGMWINERFRTDGEIRSLAPRYTYLDGDAVQPGLPGDAVRLG